MCGLTGFISTPHSEACCLEDLVASMAGRIQHRGPDDSGVWVDNAAGIALGHRRLSILDISNAGHQPMLSTSGRYVMVFNGEIYNHLDLRRKLNNSASLACQSHQNNDKIIWRGHADTETLLACFATWGIERTLESAVGMFALALWDVETRTLTLARDRMGEKPLYYGWQGDTFLFGSELKALKAHPAFQAKIDRGALALLLRHNYVPSPYSIYEGIFKLPAGNFLQLRAGARDIAPVAYWSLAQVTVHTSANRFQGSEEAALAALENHLSAAVRGQMASDVPLGALLSGGIDSSLIVALMQSNSEKPVNTFTIGFDEREYDELDHARAVAKHLGTDHNELRLTAGAALSLIPELPTIYDEPFADSSQLPTYLLMKLASQQVTVALSGDAGDEMFGGYNRYLHLPKVWQRLGWMPQIMRSSLGAALTAVPSGMINRLTGPLAKRLGVAQPGDKAHRLGQRLHDIHSIDDLYLSLVSEWPNNQNLVLGVHPLHNLLHERARWPKLPNPAARMMALDALTYLPDDILVKVDRAAMAVSLETRTPFLDPHVIQFAWSLPMRMKIRDGQSKWLLRHLLHRHVPRALVERPKMGFGIPLDDWLRGPLRDWAENLLAEDRLHNEGYLNPEPIRSAWQAHLTGRISCGYRLWSVLMFQAWLESSA